MTHPIHDHERSNETAALGDRRRFLARALSLSAAAGLVGPAAPAHAQGQAGQQPAPLLVPTGPPRHYGPNADPPRYPDPDIVVLDPRFESIKIGNSPIVRLYTGALWGEGPAWNGVGRYFLWSDIPNDVQLRWLEDDGHVSVFRKPSGNSNGNTFDREGRQISCEHGNRRVVRYEHDGSMTVLADRFDGKRFNAPNDVVVHPDGGVWFTDPGYGSLSDYEGHKAPFELKEAVYRIDPKSQAVVKTADDLFKPNGLCFSPDYKLMYITDTGASHDGKAPRNVRVYDVTDNGARLANGREFVSMAMTLRYPGAGPNGATRVVAGLADGIRADAAGNLYVAGGWVGPGYDGVHVFAPDGTRIGLIRLPEICGNICFGGPKRNRLFMVAGRSIYAVYLNARGGHFA